MDEYSVLDWAVLGGLDFDFELMCFGIDWCVDFLFLMLAVEAGGEECFSIACDVDC